MIKQLKRFTVNMVAGANVATVVLMLLVGFADHLDPLQYPVLSTLGIVFPFLLVANLLFLFFWLTFKWRKAWIPLAGYALAYVPIHIYLPLSAYSDVDGEGVVKLLSYNVEGFSGAPRYDRKEGSERLVQYIRDAGADIVCLQEAHDGGHGVIERLDSIYAHRDSLSFGANSMKTSLALFSRYPILRHERIDYPTVRNNGSVAWYLLVGSDTVLVVNNHLESNRIPKKERDRYKSLLKGEMDEDTAKAESRHLLSLLSKATAHRAPQAVAIHQYVESHRQYPILLCGDFNDQPLSFSRRVIAQGLTDCFVAAGRGVGMSYNQKGFFFRIDHVMCSSHFQPLKCVVDDKIDASDHYPVLCWLKMRDNI